MDIIAMHLVFLKYRYGRREEDFLRFHTFLLYGHICPTIGPELLTLGP
jgi:hypothetical protein